MRAFRTGRLRSAALAGSLQHPKPDTQDHSVLEKLLGTHLDAAAFLWFVVLIGGYGWLARRQALEARSIVGAVQAHRMRWMQNMAVRENRVLDGMLLGHLSHGNAFFASTSAIAMGGLAAMLGSGEKVQAMIERLPYVRHVSAELYEVKVIFLMAVFIYAFFKFAWAFRLSHYVAIMIGSTPLLTTDNRPECEQHATRTARLVGIAAEHANAGIRAFYYAIAGIAWFFHPLLFMAATTWVLVILVRRDFFSRSRRILMGTWP